MARRIVNVGLAAGVIAIVVAGACSAGKSEGTGSTVSSSSAGGSGGTGGPSAAGGDGPTTAAGGSGGELTVGTGGAGGAMGCAEWSAEAQQKEAAMMITLDMSASMTGTKWNASQLAVVTAIDKGVFDSMSLGLMTFPTSYTNPPQCFCDATFGDGTSIQDCVTLLQFFTGAPGVSCGTGVLPIIPLSYAGMNKSNDSTGVRRDIYDYLVGHAPLNNQDDGSPIYDALESGYAALASYGNVEERIMLLITDGGFSCTSVANPSRPGYLDAADCPDWEYPDSVNALISQKYADGSAPVRTFVIGVPGSDTNGEDVGSGCPSSTPCYATPPYSMKLALSSYAVSGSPDTLDPACDSTTPFTQGGADPTAPCHIDMTGGQFDANALAAAIAGVRGSALGCVYPVPEPPPNETIDLTKVNVEVELDGGTAVTIPARSDPSDDCATAACWDYNLEGEIEILGQGCDDIGAAASAKVTIVVGCETIIN